ncbi:hypothetical protein Z043_116495 [Scleropages formosus]|uniref:Centromere protein X n=1 Tax=Scleropages formosus TaxID=113540 RepID=A0A0P7WTC7_SCLFO|nr:hypothetical protein Z043_116495 [Scleropages formosus]
MFSFIVSGDAVILMAEMLKIFVEGECGFSGHDRWDSRPTGSSPGCGVWDGAACLPRSRGANNFIMCRCPEAARRSQKQAAAEDCDVVDIEHFEKILPQLVSTHSTIPVTEFHSRSLFTFFIP